MSTAPIKIGDYVKIKNYNHFTGHIGEVLTVDIMESEALISIKSKYGRQACSPQRIPLLYLNSVEKPDYGLALREKKRIKTAGGTVSMKFQSAVRGDLFYETISPSSNGEVNATPRVLAFDEVFLDKNGKAFVRFSVMSYVKYDGTFDEVIAPANDHAAKFIKLSKRNLDAMKDKRNKLETELKCLNCVIQTASRLVN